MTTSTQIHLVQLPPASPYAPSITLPYLSAQLTSAGISSRVIYVNVSVSRYLVPSAVTAALRQPLVSAVDIANLAKAELAMDAALETAFASTVVPQSWQDVRALSSQFDAGLVGMMATQLSETLCNDRCSLLGFTCATATEAALALRLAAILRSQRERIVTLLGGPYVSLGSFNFPDPPPLDAFDYVVTNGGGRTLIQLLEHFGGRAPFPDAVHTLGHIFPVIAKRDLGTSDESDLRPSFDYNEILAPSPVLPVFSAQGCSYGRCTFCSSNSMVTSYVARTTQDVVATMCAYHASGRVHHFDIVDNNFDAKKLQAFADLNDVRHLKWKATSRFYREMKTELLIGIREAGCQLLALGLESASDRQLKSMKKGFSRQTAERVLEAASSARLPIHLYVILGYPGETLEERRSTVAFLQDYRSAYVSVFAQFYDANLTSGIFVDRSQGKHDMVKRSMASERADELGTIVREGELNAFWTDTGVLLRPLHYPRNDGLFLLALSASVSRTVLSA